MPVTNAQEALQGLGAALRNATARNANPGMNPRLFAAVGVHDIEVLEYLRNNNAAVMVLNLGAGNTLLRRLDAALHDYRNRLGYKINEVGAGSEEGLILAEHEDQVDAEISNVIPGETAQRKFTRYVALLQRLVTEDFITALNGNPPIHDVLGDRELVVEFEDSPPPPPPPRRRRPPLPPPPVVGDVMLRPEKIGAKLGSLARFLEPEIYRGPDIDPDAIIQAQINKITSLRDETKVRPAEYDVFVDPTSDAVKNANEENRQRIYWDDDIKFRVDPANHDIYHVNVSDAGVDEEIWRMEVSPRNLKFTIKADAITSHHMAVLTKQQTAAMSVWDGIDIGSKCLLRTGVGHRTAKVYLKQRTPFANSGPETDIPTILRNIEYIATTSMNLLKINIVPKFDAATTTAMQRYIAAHDDAADGICWQLTRIQYIQQLYNHDTSDSSLRNILATVSSYIAQDEDNAPGAQELAQKRANYTPPS